MNFQQELVHWYGLHKRDLPWRHTNDPYIIWLSEIILQQTRIQQGLPYFERFLEAFPTVVDFAAASEEEVLRLWQGLGYYSRGRNMLHTAREVVALHQGSFPVAHSELIKLKGIGEYTAAAISSFSVGENRAVVDGNVFRVISRYFGVDIPINSTEGKRTFFALAQELIKDQNPMVYNQAIMEFGALQCRPVAPDCLSCPLQSGCVAYQQQSVASLPVKLKKAKSRSRYFNYFILESDNRVLVRKRDAGDIWQQLYDFPMLESPKPMSPDDEELMVALQNQYGPDIVIEPVSSKKHVLTHQIIYVQFFALANYIINFKQEASLRWVRKDELDALPQPKVITDFVHAFLN